MSELQDNARGLACIAENAGLVSIAKTIRDLLAENQRLTRGPSPTVPDEVALFRWLQENEADLRTWREPCGDDEYAIWWQVVKGRKSISGHPLGSPQDAIRAAMLAAAPAMSGAGPDIRPAATVPDGWRFYSADASVVGKCSLLLTRDAAGTKIWHAMSQEQKDAEDGPPLFVRGHGVDYQSALTDAIAAAMLAAAPESPA